MFLNPSATSWTYTGPPPSLSVLPFHRRLPDYNTTPLHPLPSLAQALGLAHVLVKDESNRFGLPAFKILGASWATFKAVAAKCDVPLDEGVGVEELGAAARKAGVRIVTCTAGNWGRAVARMGRYMQIVVTVFVPSAMDESTQEKIRSEGVKVEVVDGDYDATVLTARREAEGAGSILMMDTGWEGYEEIPQWVVEGYSTMLTETDEQLRDLGVGPVTHAIASVGVGSWAQAVAMHYKSTTPSAAVIAVEPGTAACLKTSLGAGKITPITTGKSIMNGMNCGTVSYTAWEVLRHGVDACVEVTDAEAHHDLQYLHSQGVKNGPCGAAPVSALRRLIEEKRLGLGRDSVVVLFSTEGAREYPVPA
ncbi:tryptophan synthase beta subunit-like PLP-dependent enzyme [Karstenula rhodostoma CBS 690.94]|uniref:Tryptophan synthase beta subunit-like PLP-dependent enzyme n=1 Tax=Karstenula rhodostoma CBS 690.94 TaxID=1392251 RepID=A0A9P4PJT8_9PLEO|nr:tryptophan synthase beta subunit-like PLP-dependent enzyme [Karstenula rhodostoma CBS 690.94]